MEDELMKIFKENDDVDFFSPSYNKMSSTQKAETDLKANNALKEMFDWDRNTNPDIVKDMSFKQYIKTINPLLIEQRAKKSKDYLGTSVDVDNKIWSTDFSKNIKSVLKRYDNNVNKLKESVIKSDKAMEYLESGKMDMDTKKMNKRTMFNKAFDSMVSSAEKDIDISKLG